MLVRKTFLFALFVAVVMHLTLFTEQSVSFGANVNSALTSADMF